MPLAALSHGPSLTRDPHLIDEWAEICLCSMLVVESAGLIVVEVGWKSMMRKATMRTSLVWVEAKSLRLVIAVTVLSGVNLHLLMRSVAVPLSVPGSFSA